MVMCRLQQAIFECSSTQGPSLRIQMLEFVNRDTARPVWWRTWLVYRVCFGVESVVRSAMGDWIISELQRASLEKAMTQSPPAVKIHIKLWRTSAANGQKEWRRFCCQPPRSQVERPRFRWHAHIEVSGDREQTGHWASSDRALNLIFL